MHSDNWVLGLDRLSSDVMAVLRSFIGLWKATVLGSQTLKKCLDGCAETLVSNRLACPCGVPATRRYRQKSQYGYPRRLALIRDVRVKADARELITFALVAVFIVWPEVNVVKLQMALDMSSSWLQQETSATR